MTITVKTRDNVTITVARDTRDKLMFIKIKSRKKNLDQVLIDLLDHKGGIN